MLIPIIFMTLILLFTEALAVFFDKDFCLAQTLIFLRDYLLFSRLVNGNYLSIRLSFVLLWHILNFLTSELTFFSLKFTFSLCFQHGVAATIKFARGDNLSLAYLIDS